MFAHSALLILPPAENVLWFMVIIILASLSLISSSSYFCYFQLFLVSLGVRIIIITYQHDTFNTWLPVDVENLAEYR